MQSTAAIKPIGRFTKKIQGQLALSTIYPPNTGPIDGPMMIPSEKMPLARARSFGGKVSNRMACEVDNNAPPASPCTKRHATSSHKLPDSPHMAEVRVNRMIDPT